MIAGWIVEVYTIVMTSDLLYVATCTCRYVHPYILMSTIQNPTSADQSHSQSVPQIKIN